MVTLRFTEKALSYTQTIIELSDSQYLLSGSQCNENFVS
jgi:hypothetical protein